MLLTEAPIVQFGFFDSLQPKDAIMTSTSLKCGRLNHCWRPIEELLVNRFTSAERIDFACHQDDVEWRDFFTSNDNAISDRSSRGGLLCVAGRV
ncbi:hypothetical protein EG68_00777 [Paragonimus skrjabini miyazakii]|uniref:Uncharacterized protein n=1 Tax=Paragonimus skrjabini miyazakii TaxID=59628 RepID=A0A8S9Z9C8_9TREM|nr:hypothetical protein EG68_00777 [Paragonimus skrjabini miyazakii]